MKLWHSLASNRVQMANYYVPSSLRQLVRERAQGRCEYCLSPESHATGNFSIEHIQPRDAGGLTEADNLALSCQSCNNFKHIKTNAYDSLSRQYVPLFHPRGDDWDVHFTWTPDEAHLIGLTPTGRATINMLRLNREGVVNLRRLLMLIGRHPPQR